MPTIHRGGAIDIRVYPDDHEPPHVHLMGPGFGLRVYLGSWRTEVVFGKPRGHEDAVRWLQANEAAVVAAWQRTRPKP